MTAQHIKEFHTIASPISPAIEQMTTTLSFTGESFDDAHIAEYQRELDVIDMVLEEAFNNLGWLLVSVWRENQEPDFTSSFNQ